jgi:hypothetical protein
MRDRTSKAGTGVGHVQEPEFPNESIQMTIAKGEQNPLEESQKIFQKLCKKCKT